MALHFMPAWWKRGCRARKPPRNQAPKRLHMLRHFGDYGDKHGSE